jgi:PAS domain S-box-containing protein
MGRRKEPAEQAAELRQHASEELVEIQSATPSTPKAPSRKEALASIQELKLNQIELKNQSAELYSTQAQLDRCHSRFLLIYENTPMGYCILSEQGMILEGNHTLAALLGETPEDLVREQFTRFISTEDQDAYYRSRRHFLETGTFEPCEIHMVTREGTRFCVRLQETAAQTAAGAPISLVSVEDMTTSVQTNARVDMLQAQLVLAEKGQSNEATLEFQTRILAAGLSKRETEILGLVGLGLTSKQIAEDLGISSRTVESHRQSIMKKLEISNGAGLVKLVSAHGFHSDRK